MFYSFWLNVMMNNHIGFNLIKWCLIRYFLQTWYEACILAKIFSGRKYCVFFLQPFDFALRFWIKQDAHSNLAKIRQTFGFVNFDVWELRFLLSVSVPKQPPLKLKSASNEIVEDCWTKSRLLQRGGKFLEEQASAFFFWPKSWLVALKWLVRLVQEFNVLGTWSFFKQHPRFCF